MRYLIDGHNLIPKLPGFSLSEIDDERKLIEWLQVFSRQKRCQVEVYFDRAPAGFAQTRKFGIVTAHFIRQGSTADDAIQSRLQHAGKAAKNLGVISSDHQVQSFARSAHATVISSDDFAKELTGQVMASPRCNTSDQNLTEEDIAYWEALFRGNNKDRG